MSMTTVPMFLLGGPSYSANLIYITLNGADEKVGHCGLFTTPDGATRSITHICWATGAVATGDDILCQLESVNATTGLYDGIIAAGASGTQTVQNTDDNHWFETALTTPYTLSSGTFLSVTFKMTNASKDVRINLGTNLYGASFNKNYIVTDLTTPGSPAKTSSYRTNVALKCSDDSYLVPLGGDINTINAAYGLNTSDTTYFGNKIVCDVQSRLVGFIISRLDPDYDIHVRLVDSSGNTLKGSDASTDMSVTYNAVYRGGDAAAPTLEYFPCPKILSADTAYYLVLVATSSSSVSGYYLDYSSLALKNQVHKIPTGWTCNMVTSPSTVSFTEDESAIAGVYPFFDQMDIGSGGGGGAPRFGDMTGGLK